ncbi:MAG: DUF6125 family protein [candidate division WOR-3 bacterium]
MESSYKGKYPQLAELDREFLISILEDAAKNWLAHDGLWFQGVERRFGMETAIEIDAEAWRQFSAIEAKRIMERHGIAPGSGISGLARALGFRLYAFINRQEITEQTQNRLVFTMKECRVQAARRRKGLDDFPCKTVGLVEYEWFARTVDERIKTRCLFCPPDRHPEDAWCSWEFVIK